MSQGSRQQLATDAEKLYACSQLWLSYNQHLSWVSFSVTQVYPQKPKFHRTTASHSVLKDAVVSYMEDIGDGPHEDVMRAFFRYHVADIAKLLKKVLDVVHASSMAASGTFPPILSEANRVVLVSSLLLALSGMCSLHNRLFFGLHSSIVPIILMFTELTFPWGNLGQVDLL